MYRFTGSSGSAICAESSPGVAQDATAKSVATAARLRTKAARKVTRLPPVELDEDFKAQTYPEKTHYLMLDLSRPR